MKATAIPVTAAARHFAHPVSRVHYQNRIFVLVKNDKSLARFIPEGEKVGTSRELAEALAHAELSAEEAIAWRKDVLNARRTLKPPEHQWR